MGQEFLLIGSKPYINIDINAIIDYFPRNGRCNMAVPFGNNGSKKDELFVCTHVAEIIKEYYEPEQTEELRKKAWDIFVNDSHYWYNREYKQNFLQIFYETFKPNDYKITRFTEPLLEHHIVSEYLEKIECPYVLHSIPRTGISAIVKKLKQNVKPFIFGFTIDEKEVRKSYYVQDHVFKKEENQQRLEAFHDKTQEIYILRWLHANNFLDATLCMLEDTLDATIETKGLVPKQESLDILHTVTGQK
tara:strand:+ start:136 stop:876 length:741 start_codon:yes stop_codon:yes gene_type:complete